LFLQEQFGTVILSSISQVGSLQSSISLAQHFEKVIEQTGSATIAHETIEEAIQQMEASEIHSLDSDFAVAAGELIKTTRKAGDSLGAAVEVVALNVPPLLGDPLYQSLKARLMGTLGGLNAVQACEIGAGSKVIERLGSENNDPIRSHGYTSNSHGGLLGGITTGMPIVCRVAFKPTSTINSPQQSVQKNLSEIDFELAKGRHDPCVGVRAGVTLESRAAIEIMNAALAQQTQQINIDAPKLF
jgi:chorismate synthase